jgi:hypothetical protein
MISCETCPQVTRVPREEMIHRRSLSHRCHQDIVSKSCWQVQACTLWRSCCTFIILGRCVMHISSIPPRFALAALWGPMAASVRSLQTNTSLSIHIHVITRCYTLPHELAQSVVHGKGDSPEEAETLGRAHCTFWRVRTINN